MTDEEDLIDQEPVLLDCALTLVNWRWFIFLGAGLAVAVGIAIALSQVPVYTATAYFIPRGALGERSELQNLSGDTDKDWRTIGSGSDLTDYFNVMLKTPIVLRATLERTFDTPEFGRVPLLQTIANDDLPTSQRLAVAIGQLGKAIQVKGQGAKIVGVSYTCANPQLAADVVNALLEEYGKFSRNMERASSEADLIANMLKTVQRDLAQKEEQTVAIKQKKMDLDRPDTQQRLDGLERDTKFLEEQLSALQTELARANIRDEQLRRVSLSEIDIVTPATPPLTRSNMSRSRIVLMAGFLGIMVTVGFATGVDFLRRCRRLYTDHALWPRWRQTRRDFVIMFVLFVLAVAAAAALRYIILAK